MSAADSADRAGGSAPEPAPERGSWWAVAPRDLPLIALACALFLILNYLPVQGFGLWGHVLRGDWILEHRALPAEDPVLAFGAGMPSIDDAWLSEVVLAASERLLETEGLSTVSSVALLLAFLLLGRALYLRSGDRLATLAGLAAALALSWGWLASLGPHVFGFLCLAALLWLTAGSDSAAERTASPAWRLWVGLPLLFVLWANLHGSFVFGLLLLACLALGRAIDVAWRERRLLAPLADAAARRWLWLLELSLLASLANPYGFALLGRAVSSLLGAGAAAQGPAMTLADAAGGAFALSWLVVLFVLRHSRLRVPAADALMLIAFSVAAAPVVSRLLWFGPVLAAVLMPHLGAFRARGKERAPGPFARIGERFRQVGLPTGGSWHFTLLALLMAWVAFALSPTGGLALGGTKRNLFQLHGLGTPQVLTAHLAANPPPAPIFNPVEWGDWIAWAGPEGLRPFATANVEGLPRRVWQDYQSIDRGEDNWERTLRRYGVRAVILDRLRHRGQVRTLRYSDDWALIHEDDDSVVFHHASTLPAEEEPVVPGAPQPEEAGP